MTVTTETQAPDAATLRSMLECMVTIRVCDETIREAINAGKIFFIYYSPRGQEAISAGLGQVLRGEDQLVTTYRGLHDQIAKGVPLPALFGEMLGKATGANKGKGGPMHIVHPESGVMVTTGVVGSGLPIANGLALASMLQGSGRVTAVCFGDGATNIGAFHEALNLAALWSLPVVFVCQNNLFGEHTPVAEHQKCAHVADRAAGYGMPGVTVDGNDPVAVRQAVAEAVERARSGQGPTLVEAVTYRLCGHFYGDQMPYMDPEELQRAWAAEPVGRFAGQLIEAGVLSPEDVATIEAAAQQRVSEALDAAIGAPFPAPGELLSDLYGEGR
jgi:pyruvate dehydrogenase E1 component alpha subunit